MSTETQYARPTPLLATTARILRALSPNALASLTLVDQGAASTQTDIASIIGRDQSTVSTYFHSLELEPEAIALVEKPGQQYAVTDVGSATLGAVEESLNELGIDLEAVAWDSPETRKRIGDALAPMTGSRSAGPFFLLDSLGARSAVGTLRSGSLTVGLDRLTHDVKRRQREQGKDTSNRQVRQMLDRFDKHGVCEIGDGEEIRLTEKGKRQVELLYDVAEIVTENVEAEVDAGPDTGELLNTAAMEMRRGRIATAWSIENADDRLRDRSHFYHRIRRIDVLDTASAEYYSSRWLTVENVSDEPTNSIVHKESGEYKISFEDLDLIAHRVGEDNQRLQVRDLTDSQPSFEQKAEIFFPEPLSPGEQVTIHYRICWPNEIVHYSAEERIQSISLTRYERGVGQLEYGITDTVEHVGIGCEKLVLDESNDSWEWERLPYTPENIAADSRLMPDVFEECEGGYLYRIASPDSPAYRICYTPVG